MPTHLPPLAYFGKTHSVSFAWPHMKQHLHIKNRDKLRRSYKGSKEATAILIAPYLKYQCEKEKLEVQEGAVLSPQSSACSPLSSACSPLSSVLCLQYAVPSEEFDAAMCAYATIIFHTTQTTKHYTYMYLHTYMHLYTYIYISIYTYIHIHTYAYLDI